MMPPSEPRNVPEAHVARGPEMDQYAEVRSEQRRYVDAHPKPLGAPPQFTYRSSFSAASPSPRNGSDLIASSAVFERTLVNVDRRVTRHHVDRFCRTPLDQPRCPQQSEFAVSPGRLQQPGPASPS
ncbi:hypothetical protein ILUMI_07812 [Ignelater luminosus]|uniref:Uncharacterized protein n=1 Tax=Ignelater luminosus TaxID=2038154 RepID=A0A8K0GHN1_IGNLU|nr:hypothetical protein ILUMI_07812 [Ignelater luminosus]